jgi:hypothetical protein
VPLTGAVLQRLRRLFPTRYWRIRNAIALAQLYAARRSGAREEPYDAAFWDFHSTGDWDGFVSVVRQYVARARWSTSVAVTVSRSRRSDVAMRRFTRADSTIRRPRWSVRGIRVLLSRRST